MIITAIILSVLLLIALLRVGVIIEYSSEGLKIWSKFAFIKLRVHDSKDKKPKKKKKKKVKDKDKKSSLKPGSLREFLEMLKIIKNMLGRLKRKLLIKTLIIHYTSASDNPAKTALQFGAASAVFGTVLPILERHFRIKKRELNAWADFNANEPGIYAKLTISIAIWESLYVLFALLPIFSIVSTNANSGKEINKDGKSTNKRADGNHDAENKGDD